MACEIDTTEEVEDDEPSALEYARANGLSCNHLVEPLLKFDTFFLIDSLDVNLLDDSLLHQFQLDYPIKADRLVLSRESAELISKAIKNEAVDSFDDPVVPQSRQDVRWKSLVELPLLRSVNEVDCKEFARRDDFELEMKDIRFPLEVVEGEDGLDLDEMLFTLGAGVVEDLRKEKLTVSREAVECLSKQTRDDWTKEDEKNMWDCSIKYNKSCTLEPVTPPLSPLPKAYIPYEPSPSDTEFDLPILSDPASLTKDDLDKLEKQIFDQDAPTPARETRRESAGAPSETLWEDVEVEGLYSPLASTKNTPVKPERVKVEYMKVEETLTPPNPTPFSKSVHFNDFIETMSLMANTTPISDTLGTEDFEELFGEAAEQARRQSEQETLIHADTTARVEVPLMDFSAPQPPWATIRKNTEPIELLATQRAMINEHITANMRLVWKVQKQANLKWNPFPHELAKVVLDEHWPYGEELWKIFVIDPKADELIDTTTLTWKPPGLKILKEDEDDDDEIEPGTMQIEHSQDMAFLVKKRKLQLDERNSVPRCISNKQYDPFDIFPINCPPGHEVSKFVAPSAAVNPLSRLREEEELGGILGGNRSTAAALDNFLEIRGTKKFKLMDSSYFAATSTKVVPDAAATSFHQQAIEASIPKLPITTAPLPTPTSAILNTVPNVVISSELLKNRALTKLIEKNSPGIKLVERDFTAHNTTIWMPNSVTRSPLASSLSSEADIIISVKAGIILTFLQKIKQKPLPGQKAKAAIRDRIEKVCVRYEKLIVLVSEGSTTEKTHGIDANDCEALSEFIGFTSGLDCTITVLVIGGSQETLATWITTTISQNQAPLNLLDEETHWEVFLRRAGMNAVAAQVVISILQAPDGVDPSSPSKAGFFGLTAFVEMGREERIAKFGQICGTRVIERICAIVDGVWK